MLCPRCGERSDLKLKKAEDGSAFIITCINCKTKLFIPNHPFLDMGVDIIKDGINYYEKLKGVGFLLKSFFKK